MKNLVLILSCIIGLFSCKQEMCNCEMSNELIQANDSIILKLNGIENGIEDYWKRSEQKLLQKQQFEQYRWSMKNVLAHYQKIYTVLNKNNSPQLNIVERIVPTTVNFNTDSTIRDTTIPIEINQWRNFKRLVDENCFWVSSPIYKEDIVDGTQVVFEGYTPLGNNCTAKSYHITIRNLGYEDEFIEIRHQMNKFDKIIEREF